MIEYSYVRSCQISFRRRVRMKCKMPSAKSMVWYPGVVARYLVGDGLWWRSAGSSVMYQLYGERVM